MKTIQNIIPNMLLDTNFEIISLSYDTTIINLNDYFIDLSKLSSFEFSVNLKYELSEDKEQISIKTNQDNLPFLFCLNLIYDEIKYTIILKKSLKQKQKIYFNNNYANYSKVQIAGDFNNWNPESNFLSFNGYSWETELLLNPGRICYQFVIDGKWILDPENKDTISNNMGGLNSVMFIGSINLYSIPFLETCKFYKNNITINVQNKISEYFVLYNNNMLCKIKYENNEIIIQIPDVSKKIKRSYIRVFSFNDYGISNDLLIPLEYGKVIEHSDSLTRFDYESTVMYFLLVDRFKNDNNINFEPVIDEEVHFKSNFQGGNIKGILDKTKKGYFKKLGVNTIWLSPINQNPKEAYKEFPKPNIKSAGYHGYWPISSTKIDNRLGTENDFKFLVDEVHEQDMNILLDFVSNHVHENHPLYINNPEYATELILADGKPNIRLWDDHRFTTWFDLFLPTLDYSNHEALERMTDYALFWLKKFNIDGFRHDATKHVSNNFWRTLTLKIKKQIKSIDNKQVFQVGETFGSRELIGSYVGSGLLDGQFDFNLYFDTRRAFADDSISFISLYDSIYESLQYYGYNHKMGNISGNHDLSRFISYADGGVSFEEDDKAAGWAREINVENIDAFKKLLSLLAFINTIPGIPVIYYGDEIGLAGANDPDNRRMHKFDNLSENELYVFDNLSKIIKLRRTNLALIYGNFKTIKADNDTFIYYRKYFERFSIIIFNKSSNKKNINIKIPFDTKTKQFNSFFNSKIKFENNHLQFNIKPISFEIIYY